MRYRMGKGETVAFDNSLEVKLEVLRAEKGFYPTLRTIGESFTPPRSPFAVNQALSRLAAAGRLSDEARHVYDSKNNKGVKNEKGKDDKKSNVKTACKK